MSGSVCEADMLVYYKSPTLSEVKKGVLALFVLRLYGIFVKLLLITIFKKVDFAK